VANTSLATLSGRLKVLAGALPPSGSIHSTAWEERRDYPIRVPLLKSS
jgi:hypothetical protein